MCDEQPDQTSPGPRPRATRLVWAASVFIVVAGGYFLLRSSLPNYVFDDSRHMYNVHAQYLENPDGYVSPWPYWKGNLRAEFANDSLREYRPLSFFQHTMGMSHYARDLTMKPLGFISPAI